MNMDEIIAKARANALAAAEAALEKQRRKEQQAADNPAARRAVAAEKQRKVLEAARQREAKLGLDLAEEFLRDISPNILRLMARDDIGRLMSSGIRLTINFSKTGEANPPSFAIFRSGSKGERIIYRPVIEQWAANDAMFLEKFRQESGGIQVSSAHEMLLEMLRLTRENNKLRSYLSQRDAPRQDEDVSEQSSEVEVTMTVEDTDNTQGAPEGAAQASPAAETISS